MAISTHIEDGFQYVTLVDAVDIEQAADLKRILMEAIGSAARVCIQVSGATAVDVTTVQLIWAAASCSSSATELEIQGPWSEQVEESFSHTGLSPVLDLMSRSAAREETDVLATRH